MMRTRGFQRLRRVARQRVVRHDMRPEHGGEHDQDEQREGKAGDRIFADDIARVFVERGKRAFARRGYGNVGHASSLTRGSTTPYSTSMIRLSITYITAMVRTKPCTGA